MVLLVRWQHQHPGEQGAPTTGLLWGSHCGATVRVSGWGVQARRETVTGLHKFQDFVFIPAETSFSAHPAPSTKMPWQ